MSNKNEILSLDSYGNWQIENGLSIPNGEYCFPPHTQRAIDLSIAHAIDKGYIQEIDNQTSAHVKPYIKGTRSLTETSIEIGIDLFIERKKKYGNK